MKRACFTGRWQPPHLGHDWLVAQKLSKGIPILILVRVLPPDDKNPLTTEQVVEILEARYAAHDVVIMTIPDIESINYGRGVGYSIEEHVPPTEVGYISATQIRKCLSEKDDSWKSCVDPSIHQLVVKYLG